MVCAKSGAMVKVAFRTLLGRFAQCRWVQNLAVPIYLHLCLKTRPMLTASDLANVTTREEIVQVAKNRGLKVKPAIDRAHYREQLLQLQVELAHLVNHIQGEGRRIAVIFEGRDAAGKGGSIKRFVEYINPHASAVVALTKPTDEERGQWYFQRYVNVLPNAGEIRFFDRSWYNRAVVEPVMGFCTPEQYKRFMRQVGSFEHMLREDGIELIKFWFDISKKEQKKRFEGRKGNPLKEWKFSEIDEKGQKLWDTYTEYKERMFSKTHTPFSPWVVIDTDDKRKARLESMRYVLNQFDYPDKGKSGAFLINDPNIIFPYFRPNPKFDL